MSALVKSHVVDVLGNVIGRDQPIMRIDKALELVSILDEKVFADDDILFFDPFCKAGEILFACAYKSCEAKSKNKLMSATEIYREIFASNRYFALAPDERHHRLSLRTFLGNKNSHDDKHNHIIRNGNYLSEIDGRLNKNKFIVELEAMIEYIKKTAGNKKIIAVGNPPYQESDGGHGKSARAIYNFFIEQLIDSKQIDSFVLVIPARWFAAGKGLDKFRTKMLQCKNLRAIRYFVESRDVFPQVFIGGGVCFFYYDRQYQGNPVFVADGEQTTLDLQDFDIIPDDPKAPEIVRKIKNIWRGEWLSDIAWSGKAFGLRTFWFSKNDHYDKNNSDAVPCLHRGRKLGYVQRCKIKKNIDKINHFKVAIPRVWATGARRCTLPANNMLLLDKGTITTETYNIVDTFKTKYKAQNLISYLQTDFARYLLGLRKTTQDIPKRCWLWVPYMDTCKKWTDEELFDYFQLTDSEVNHLKKKVREWS